MMIIQERQDGFYLVRLVELFCRKIRATNPQVNVSATVAPDKFLFIITDSIGDGLSDVPTGDYQVNVNGTEVGSGGRFPFTFEKG
jgi:hypothetical protein